MKEEINMYWKASSLDDMPGRKGVVQHFKMEIKDMGGYIHSSIEW